jgi:hypothetical protein
MDCRIQPDSYHYLPNPALSDGVWSEVGSCAMVLHLELVICYLARFALSVVLQIRSRIVIGTVCATSACLHHDQLAKATKFSWRFWAKGGSPGQGASAGQSRFSEPSGRTRCLIATGNACIGSVEFLLSNAKQLEVDSPCGGMSLSCNTGNTLSRLGLTQPAERSLITCHLRPTMGLLSLTIAPLEGPPNPFLAELRRDTPSAEAYRIRGTPRRLVKVLTYR